MAKHCKVAIAVLCLSVVTAACGSSAHTTSQSSSSHAAAASSATSSATVSAPAVPANHAYSGTATDGHLDGYEWSIKASATVGQATVTTMGQQPGFVMVSAPVTASGTLTNTTSGYTATLKGEQFFVAEMYPKSNPLCAEKTGPTGVVAPVYSAGIVDLDETSRFYNQNPSDGQQTSRGPRCAVVVADYYAGNPCPGNENSANLTTLNLAPEQSTSFTAVPDGSIQPCGVTGTPPDPGNLVFQNVPAALGTTVAEALNTQPSDWAIFDERAGETESDNPGAAACTDPVQALQNSQGIDVNYQIASKSGNLDGCAVNLNW